MARVTVVNDNSEFLELVRDILEDLDTKHRVATLLKPFGLGQLTTALDQLLTSPGRASPSA